MSDGVPASADAVVIGAGCAGLAAAVRLAAAGRRVVVIEESPRLGGRATSFVDRESGERVDNGQHALFGCYRETFEFLRTIGAADRAPVEPQLALTMAGDDGRRSELRCPAVRPPWHLALGVLGWRGLSLGARLGVLRLAPLLRAVKGDGAAAVAARVPPAQTVAQWLAAHGQSHELCEWLWNPLAIAALNQSPESAAAAPFVRVLGELFGPRVEDAAIALPVVPLDDLFGLPARAFIEARGGAVALKTPARVLVNNGRAAGVRVNDREIAAPVVVSSVPWHAFGRLWDGSVPDEVRETAAAAARTESSPIVTVNLWFQNAPAIGGRFVGLVGGPLHWVFDKSAIYGDKTGHLSTVVSGATELAPLDNAELTRRAVQHLTRAIPQLASHALLRSVVVREQRATFSLAPGGPPRPATRTALPGFFLAGDWTDTGLPATIEGAVVSGHAAAAAALGASR